jgi:hypothetical protein
LDCKLGEKRKKRKDNGKRVKGMEGVRREKAACLFRKKWKGKGRKKIIIIPNLFTLGEIEFLTKFVDISLQAPSLPFLSSRQGILHPILQEQCHIIVSRSYCKVLEFTTTEI